MTKGPDPDWDDASTSLGDVGGVHAKFKREWSDALRLKTARGVLFFIFCFSMDYAAARAASRCSSPSLLCGPAP